MATLQELKTEVFDYVRFSLADGIVDVELDPAHYETALKQAVLKYRQRSSNSVVESFAFLQLAIDQDKYILPQEVISVKQAYRRSFGSTTGKNSSQFEPFESAYVNMYMLQAGRVGGMLNYELFSQYQELSMLMFGGFLNFKYNKVTKELQLFRRPRSSDEIIMLHTYNYKPDVVLLSEYMSLPWLRDYTLAQCKMMLGQAYEKFSTIAGPQGGTSLNGSALKTEAQTMMEKLEEDLKNYIDGGDPLSFIIG